MSNRHLHAAILFTLLFYSLEASAMLRFFKPIYLFSQVEGTVVKDGAPVANAKIIQKYNWHWKDKNAEMITNTDENGRFTFPEIKVHSFSTGFIPHEPVVRQTITIHLDGKEYRAWEYDKRDYEPNTELLGKPFRMLCDLEAEDGLHLISRKHNKRFYGICRIAEE